MTEVLLQIPLLVVLIIVLICWCGIFWYLRVLGRKIAHIEKKLS